jgi:two-component system cell cycle response regulator DivK
MLRGDAPDQIRSGLALDPDVAVTSHAVSGDERKGREADCDAHVTKPYSPRQLLAKLREFLQ